MLSKPKDNSQINHLTPYPITISKSQSLRFGKGEPISDVYINRCPQITFRIYSVNMVVPFKTHVPAEGICLIATMTYGLVSTSRVYMLNPNYNTLFLWGFRMMAVQTVPLYIYIYILYIFYIYIYILELRARFARSVLS